MTLVPVQISSFATGLDTDLEPWLAPPDSFSVLENAHVKHGYIQRRNGYNKLAQMSAFNTAIPMTGISNANPAVVLIANTSTLTDGQTVFITGVLGTTEVNGLYFTVANIVLNTSFELAGIDSTAYGVYGGAGSVYPVIASTDRVMGIWRFNQADNTKTTLVFNTTRANALQTVGGITSFKVLDLAPIMSGSDTDFVVATNWQSSDIINRLYFTNGKAYDGASLDGVRYYDISGLGNSTTLFDPDLDPGGTRKLYGGKLIFSIKQRLIVLNTYELSGATTSNHPQRARWCQAQGPSNWDDITPGGGGFVDAPTGDQIISAQALQDVIIVHFTNSVWTLRPVPDPALPFRWDKINDFRACDGKMATAPYDRDVRALGIRGITATDGTQTQRADERIQDFTVNAINVDEFKKVFCKRDFVSRRWWTLYPAGEDTENTGALIFDDESRAYSTYKIAMNCLGYGNLGQDYAFEDFTVANSLDFDFSEFVDEEDFDSFFYQENQETFLGGDISGNVFIMDSGGSDDGELILSDLFTAAWNPFKDQGLECQLSHVDLLVDTDEYSNALIGFYKDMDTNSYAFQTMDFLPNLNYVSSVIDVDLLNPVNVNSASHGLATGSIVYIYGIIGTEELNDAPFTVTYVDENNFTLDGVDGTAYSAYITGGQIVRRKFYKTQVWKRVFAGGIGFQHRINVSASGIKNPFKIHSFTPYFRQIAGRRPN